MANRALIAKVERAKRQARVAAAAEYTKPCYAGNATLGAAITRHTELAALAGAFVASGGTIKRVPCTGKSPERANKRGGFVADRSSISYGAPYRAGIRYATTSCARLIPRG